MQQNRYHRQMLVKEFGEDAQAQLVTKHAVLIGGGGLGSNSANILVRMGIGRLTVIDNDTVDQTNLHRTTLFTEQDIGKSKALVLQERLRAINSDVQVTGIKRVVISENIDTLVRGADVIIDGTDTMTLRFLINDVSVKREIPWVYAGVCDTVGMVMGIIPKKGPCLQCISRDIPEATGETPVLGSLPSLTAAIQCNETLKLLLGRPLAGLIVYDTWSQSFETLNVQRNPDCQVCGRQKWRML